MCSCTGPKGLASRVHSSNVHMSTVWIKRAEYRLILFSKRIKRPFDLHVVLACKSMHITYVHLYLYG
jgi:hypothetical protein